MEAGLHEALLGFLTSLGASREQARWLSVGVLVAVWALANSVLSFLSSVTSSTYRRLPYPKRVEWDNRVLSTVHSILTTQGAFRCLLELGPDAVLTQVHTSTPLREFYLFATLAYCIFDTTYLLRHWNVFPDVVMIIHHVVIMWTYIGGIFLSTPTYGTGVMIAFQIQEGTSPFNNLRWHLLVADQKQSALYRYNAFAFLISFFILRVVWGTYVLIHIFKIFPTGLIVPGCWLCTSVCWLGVVFCLLQYYWFALVLRGAIAFLGGSSKPKGKTTSKPAGTRSTNKAPKVD